MRVAPASLLAGLLADGQPGDPCDEAADCDSGACEPIPTPTGVRSVCS